MEVVRGRKKGSKARLFAVVVGTPRVRSGSFACFHFYMFACVCVCVCSLLICVIFYIVGYRVVQWPDFKGLG